MMSTCVMSNSYGINLPTGFVEMRKANHRKSTANTENYVKKFERKKSRRETFPYNVDDYNGVSLVC